MASTGDGAGQVNGSSGVAVDQADNLYVTDWKNRRIQKFSPSSRLLNQWTVNDGPVNLAVDRQGNMFVIAARGQVLKFSSSGQEVARWTIPGVTRESMIVGGLAVDSQGSVYVAAPGDRVIKYSGDGQVQAEWDGKAGPVRFTWLWGLAVDEEGNLYLVEYADARITKLSPSGAVLARWGSTGHDENHLSGPRGVALDRKGNVYVTDSGNGRVVQLTTNLERIQSWGTRGVQPGQFICNDWAAVDSRGVIYVAEACENQRIQKYSRGGD